MQIYIRSTENISKAQIHIKYQWTPTLSVVTLHANYRAKSTPLTAKYIPPNHAALTVLTGLTPDMDKKNTTATVPPASNISSLMIRAPPLGSHTITSYTLDNSSPLTIPSLFTMHPSIPINATALIVAGLTITHY